MLTPKFILPLPTALDALGLPLVPGAEEPEAVDVALDAEPDTVDELELEVEKVATGS